MLFGGWNMRFHQSLNIMGNLSPVPHQGAVMEQHVWGDARWNRDSENYTILLPP